MLSKFTRSDSISSLHTLNQTTMSKSRELPKKHAPKPPDVLRKSGPHEDKRRKEKHRKDYREELPADKPAR